MNNGNEYYRSGARALVKGPRKIKVKPTKKLLNLFSRKQLRNYARSLGVRVGQNKSDTILNIFECSGACIVVNIR